MYTILRIIGGIKMNEKLLNLFLSILVNSNRKSALS